ncbi:adenylate/guanylate cyclase domain-containing protein [Flagellimonas sp. CMM7]|uniref:adenylate/guanylate cyclase domain-containing protein n=1 Tax=Flagellimonas sp. CMM7 TaxID=2654676 RepID=UPI0013D70432|nr:adenylate/guanylate cyclase domain-containing protein [Flagellimonas sp. CMM7]UII80329.1 adenylate/guanylate cyclase domain-containing protein [Flagellimonas sp. CMM7]
MKTDAIDLLRQRLDAAIAQSEFKRIKLFIIALFLGLAIISFDFFLVSGTTSFFNDKNTKFYIVLWFLAFLAYEVMGYFIAKSYLKKKIVVPDILKIGNVAFEAAMPGLLLFFLCYVEKSDIFLDSPLMLFYFILIGVSALNLDLRLSLVTGLVAAGGYLFVTVWAIQTFDKNGEVLYFPPILYMARSLFMFMAALGAVFLTREIKNTVQELVVTTTKKEEIQSLFGQQVSKEVVEALMANNNTSEKREVSVLFMDIRKFSVFAEQNKPADVIRYQNDIFSPLIGIINKHKGVTNQILGDGLMATFGAPVENKNHANRALRAGLEILEEVERLSSSGAIPETRIGIGLHTGKVVMGNIGNDMRKQFSISGTAVIIAARLEELNKKYGSQFLVSQEFYNELNMDKYAFEMIDQLKLRNIDHEVKVYKVS